MRIELDPFYEDTYDLDDYFFEFQDYLILFNRNCGKTDIVTKNRRLRLQKKLREINNLVKKEMLNIGLDHHWVDQYITSQPEPNPTNEYKVNWIGVRYFKKNTVKQIKKLKLAGDGFGAPKYSCIQFSLFDEGFTINLFHAVKNGAVDRDFLKNQMTNLNFRKRLIACIESLKGNNLVWHASNVEFKFDKEDSSNFIEYYKENDKEGTESFLSYLIPPDDIILKDVNSICETVVEKTKLLLPMLNLVASNWKNL